MESEKRNLPAIILSEALPSNTGEKPIHFFQRAVLGVVVVLAEAQGPLNVNQNDMYEEATPEC